MRTRPNIDIAQRKRLDEELNWFFTRSLGLLCIAGFDGRFKRLNPAWERILGWSTEELLGRPYLDFVHPDDRPATASAAQRSAAGDEVVGFENRYRCKDGSYRWLVWRSAPLVEQQAVYAVAHDVTELKQAQEALGGSEARLKEAQSLAHIGSWELDLVRNVLHWSDEIYRIFEIDPKRFGASYEAFLNAVHPADRELVDKAYSDSVRNKTPYEIIHRLLMPDGRTKFVHERCETFYDANGNPLRSVGTVQDITERERASRLLESSRKQFRDLAEFAPDALIVADQSGKVTLVNRQAEVLFGWSREELLNQPVETFIPQELRARHIGLREQYLQAPTSRAMGEARTNKQGVRKDGTAFPVDIALSPLVTPEGTLVVAAVRDVTERQRLDQQLLQRQKMEAVGRLAGGIAHDFNNLLGVIIGFCDLLRDRVGSDDIAQRQVEQIRNAGDSAAKLTRQLLAFSRKQVLEPRVLGLNGIISDMGKILHRLIGEDIKLVTIAAPDLGQVKADPGQIEQVILNLAVNARDAMPKGGRLTIETANVVLDESYAQAHIAVVPGRYVMLAVSDTGGGMDAETQARIFEPFFTTKKEGTGLGLATVYGIVKQSGGNIWVYSEPGRGTIFKAYFPRVDELVEVTGMEAAGAVTLGGSETILLVEDSESLRTVAREFLERSGYAVLEAGDGTEALRLVEQCKVPIHLLLTDVVMPSMGGHDLAEQLRKLHPETKVLYISGYTDNAIARHGVLEKGVALLSKPFTRESLTRKVRQVLDS